MRWFHQPRRNHQISLNLLNILHSCALIYRPIIQVFPVNFLIYFIISLCLFFSVFRKRALRLIFLFLLFFTLTSFDIFILLFTIFYSLCLLPSFFLLSTLLSFIRMFPSFIFLLGFCNYLFLNLFFYPKQVYSNKSLYF